MEDNNILWQCPFCGSRMEIVSGGFVDRCWIPRCSERISCGCTLRVESTYEKAVNALMKRVDNEQSR